MAHIITRLIRGGADENTLHGIRGLDSRRYRVDLVIGRGSDPACVAALENLSVHHVPELVRDPHPWLDVCALLRLAALLRRNRYQIVHTHTAKAGFLGRLAAALVGTPTIVHTLHGVTFHEHLPAWQRHLYLLLERIAGRFTHQYVAVGEDVRNVYQAARVGEPRRYETIYSGMPLEEYLDAGAMQEEEREQVRAELGLDPGHLAVAMAARLEPRKGHRYLFEAVARITRSHPEMRVLILGEGPARDDLEREAAALGIGNVVRFLGFRTDLPRVLAATDVSVLTSLWEGLPRVLVQSAATGRPILTFDVEGAWEVVRDGHNGFIVPTRDVDALSRRLDLLLRDAALRRSLGQAGRARVGSAWTVETMVERLDRMYQRLVTDAAA